MESYGVRLSEKELCGMRWNGQSLNGIEWNRVEWTGTKWDGLKLNWRKCNGEEVNEMKMYKMDKCTKLDELKKIEWMDFQRWNKSRGVNWNNVEIDGMRWNEMDWD